MGNPAREDPAWRDEALGNPDWADPAEPPTYAASVLGSLASPGTGAGASPAAGAVHTGGMSFHLSNVHCSGGSINITLPVNPRSNPVSVAVPAPPGRPQAPPRSTPAARPLPPRPTPDQRPDRPARPTSQPGPRHVVRRPPHPPSHTGPEDAEIILDSPPRDPPAASRPRADTPVPPPSPASNSRSQSSSPTSESQTASSQSSPSSSDSSAYVGLCCAGGWGPRGLGKRGGASPFKSPTVFPSQIHPFSPSNFQGR